MYHSQKEQKNANSRPVVSEMSVTAHLSFGMSIPFDQIEKLYNRSFSRHPAHPFF
jgi:hypothetical protein